ncbi:hypothetical protein Leryth_003882 [Lithospermum erythrorhizon]|nr:hypothetical protein Leryth_003882 [Lithospermum erythrorhizon]
MTKHYKSVLVYGVSWLVILLILFVMKTETAIKIDMLNCFNFSPLFILDPSKPANLLCLTVVSSALAGLQISRILGGHRKDRSSRNKE